MSQQQDPARTLGDVADQISKASDGDSVRLDEIVTSLGRRSYGPLLLVPSLISILPIIGALPGVTWTMALLACLISIQFVLVRQKLWLPPKLAEAEFPRDKLNDGLEKARPWIDRLDRLFRPRIKFLLRPAFTWVISVMCLALSIAMFPFSVIPGGVVVPGLALAILAFGLTTHDGIFILIGCAAAGGAIAGLLFWLVI